MKFNAGFWGVCFVLMFVRKCKFLFP